MRKILSAAILMMAGCCPIAAQQLTVEGTITGTVPEGQCLYVVPVTAGQSPEADSIQVRDGRLSARTSLSPWGIYKVIAVNQQRQSTLPVTLTADNGKATLRLQCAEGGLSVSQPTADGAALQAFNSYYIDRAKRLWTDGKSMDAAAVKSLLTSYALVADSIAACHGASANMLRYLSLWASAITYETIESLRFITGKTAAEVGMDDPAFLQRLCTQIDCDMAAAFPQLPRMVVAALPKGSLSEQIGYVRSHYTSEFLKKGAEAQLLSHYVSSFKYAEHYEQGLAELTALTEQYGLDQRYLNVFKQRRASIAGTPFPEAATLFDLEGRPVDFAQFRGKFVYIDLWASWCVPCIKEIPHLKEVEAKMKDSDIVFVSISIDKDEAAWKRKVADLGLSGHLYIDRGNKLAEALNVRGIPFFLIYDREGKLYKYSAYRPSDSRLLPLLQGLK